MRHWARRATTGLLGLAAMAGVAMTGMATAPGAQAADQVGFERWISDFAGKMRARGVSQKTLDAAFSGAKLNDRALELDKEQPEFVQPIWVYLDKLVSEKRIAAGKEAFARENEKLSQIQARYGVPAEVVAAIWGVESNFGEIRGDYDVPDALATLAYAGRAGKNGSRRKLWLNQLEAALKILENGDIEPRHMLGSWAGAMGHTQFIPTSYQAYAVDFHGDGKRDIWSDDPTDALASTANYLKTVGKWRTGQPWGFQVALPADFDYALLGGGARPVSEWARRGVTLSSGGPLPEDADEAKLLLPAGHRGPAFLTLQNFNSVLRYNNATAYALAVLLLSERIAGKPPRALAWPTDDRPLKREEREELQEKLTALGFDTGGVDGILGGGSKAAIRRFQTSNSMIADGYPSAALLSDIRRALDARNAPVLAATAGPAEAADIREIQALLTGLGYDTGGVDGKVGSKTTRAIRRFVDGRDSDLSAEPSLQLLAELRRAVRGQ